MDKKPDTIKRPRRSVWGIIEQDGKILFTLRSETTSRSGQWCLPGGGIHVDESPEEACVREIHEEVGLSTIIEDLVCEDGGFIYFRCVLKEHPAQITLARRECCDYQWVYPRDLQALGPIMELARMQRVFRALNVSIGFES